MSSISIVSPVYQASNIVPTLVKQLILAVEDLTSSFEIILVDDRSTDGSWEAIREECQRNRNVKGIRLSKNFGQHSAITAGLVASQNEWIVVIDCDLQDRPDQIKNLYKKALEGYDIVFARRQQRKDSYLKKLYSKLFYSLFSYLTNTKQDSSIANFGIYHKKSIAAILEMNDYVRYFPTMIQWIGFRSTSVNVKHAARLEGKSTYNLKRMLTLAVNNIVSFSDKPLRIVAQSGLFASILFMIIGILYLVGYFLGITKLAGYTSLIISIWLTMGINMFVLGLVGIYIGKSFEKVKGRPIYIIDEEVNND